MIDEPVSADGGSRGESLSVAGGTGAVELATDDEATATDEEPSATEAAADDEAEPWSLSAIGLTLVDADASIGGNRLSSMSTSPNSASLTYTRRENEREMISATKYRRPSDRANLLQLRNSNE